MKALKTVTAYRCWGLESLLPNISKLSSKAAAVPRSLRVRRLRSSARWEIKPPKDEVQQRSNFHNCGNRINLTLIFGDTVVINQPHCKPVGWPQIAHCNHDNVIFIATSAQITRFSVFSAFSSLSVVNQRTVVPPPPQGGALTTRLLLVASFLP